MELLLDLLVQQYNGKEERQIDVALFMGELRNERRTPTERILRTARDGIVRQVKEKFGYHGFVCCEKGCFFIPKEARPVQV